MRILCRRPEVTHVEVIYCLIYSVLNVISSTVLKRKIMDRICILNGEGPDLLSVDEKVALTGVHEQWDSHALIYLRVQTK